MEISAEDYMRGLFNRGFAIPASSLYKSTEGRYRPVSYPDGPITARYRFIKNAYWDICLYICLFSFSSIGWRFSFELSRQVDRFK